MPKSHGYFMELALEEARKAEAEGNALVGSVIVLDDEVVARGHNLEYTSLDVTAHAETVAIRNATQALKRLDLSGCTLYTTMEPCPMCCGAIMYARISSLVLGGRMVEAGPTFGPYSVEKLLDLTQWGARLRLVTDVLQKRGEELMLKWWQEKKPRT